MQYALGKQEPAYMYLNLRQIKPSTIEERKLTINQYSKSGLDVKSEALSSVVAASMSPHEQKLNKH